MEMERTKTPKRLTSMALMPVTALCLSLTAGARERVFPAADARAEAWRGAELVSTPAGERLAAAEGSESNFWAGVRYVFPRGLDLSRRARIVAPVSNLTARPLSFNLYLQSDRWQGEPRGGHLTLPPFGAGEIACDLRAMPWRLDEPADFPGMRGSLSPTGGSLFDLRHVDSVRVVRDYGDAEFVVGGLFAEDAERQADAKVLPLKTFFPFVDRFGQFRHDTWPGKARDESDLAKDRAEEDDWFMAHGECPIPDADRFGGWAGGPRLKSTGFFRTEKVDGRWWLVDPDGRLFFSHGVDCVELTGNWTGTGGVRTNWFERLPTSPAANPRPGAVYFYAENLVRKYGGLSEEVAAARAHERLRAWGLNTIGNWSCPRVYGLARTPYVISVESPKRGQVDPLGRTILLPDAFSPSFERDLSSLLRRHAAKMKGDPWCLGVFVDNELGWGGFTNFLPLAKAYYAACERAVRRELPNHLYLGSRFAGGDAAYHKVAARHCDVVSFNEYAHTMGRDLPAGAMDKPMIIGEFHFGALDRGLFHTGLVPTADQHERARCYGAYMMSCLAHPRVVGAHWFQWIDQPLTGRGFDAENFQIGFLTVTDRPQPELVEAARAVARTMYARRYGPVNRKAPR